MRVIFFDTKYFLVPRITKKALPETIRLFGNNFYLIEKTVAFSKTVYMIDEVRLISVSAARHVKVHTVAAAGLITVKRRLIIKRRRRLF